MENEIKVIDEIGGHNSILFRDTYMRYIALSKYLFANEENAIYDINEMSSKCQFYKQAKSIAKSLNISWKNMSHEDSNRIMLALLEDTYNTMKEVGEKENLIIEVSLIIKK